MLKKVLAASVVCAGLAAALGSFPVMAEEVPVVKVCIPNYDSPADTDVVEEEINKIAEAKYGVRMDIEFIATGNWAQQTNLMLTSDEVDVLALFGTPFSTFVNNGQLLDITERWENAGEAFKAEWNDTQLLPYRKDGKLYGIPNFRGAGEKFGGMIDEDIAAEFGIEDEQYLTFEELDEFLQAAHEKYPERYGLVPTGGTCLISQWTWDGMGDSAYLGVLQDGGQESMDVVNLFEAEDFLNFTQWARKWYEDGITMPDILSNTESWKSLFASDKAIAAINSIGVNSNEGLIKFYITERYASTDFYQQVGYGINANTKDPDASWTVLEALYTDKEIGTLLTNGIEGRNYVLNDNGTASYPEGKDGSTAGYNLMEAYWFVPYAPNSIPKDTNGEGFFDRLVEQQNNAVESKGLGFAFDNSEVIDEYSACAGVMDKYYKALMSGGVDRDSIIEQAKSELEAAGVQTVIDAKRTQFEAWLSAQN